MTGIEKITERILHEAEEKASEIKAQAEKEADALISERVNKANAETANLKKLGDDKAASAEEKVVIAAGMEAKRMIALQKNEIIEKAFDKALSDMIGYPDEKYFELLLNLSMSVLKDGCGGEILLNSANREKFGSKLAETINAKTGGKVSLAKDTADIKGGVIVRRESIEYNCSLEAIIRMLKDEMAYTVKDALFGKGE